MEGKGRFKNGVSEAKEMTCLLRVYTALAEGTHVTSSQLPVTLAPPAFDTSDLLRYLHTYAYTLTSILT